VGWQELSGGRVAGTDVRWYAGATPPTIHGVTASPSPVPVHGTATLTASYQGKAPLTFQWKKNGVNLGNSGRISGATSPVLSISDAGESDEGTYSVLISNPLDCAESAGAALAVVPDTVPPIVAMTSPANNASIAKAEKAFRGTATDNAKVVRVEYRLNSNAWIIASGTTNWEATVALEPGTNRFRSRAVDASGLISSVAEVKVIRIVESPIQLLTQGQGMITGATNGELLHVNRNYTLTATPAPGNLFVNWTGGTCPGPLTELSGSPALPFTMRTGLCVQANFMVNPFLSVRGTYHGLYYETTGANAESSGAFRLTVTKRGGYSGEVLHDLDQQPVSGQFALDGKATNRIVCPGMDAICVWELELDQARTNFLTGHITDNAGAWDAQLLGDRAPVYGTNASPYQGKYTVVIPGTRDPAITNQPAGDSYGTLLVDAAGVLTFGGSLADGKTVSRSAQVSPNGIWPLYAPLYGGAGMMLSWVQLTTDPLVASPVRSDVLLWGRPAISNAACYSDGFEAITTLTGSKYAAARPVLPFTEGIVAFVGGNLASNLVYPVTLTASNTVLGPASLRMSITRSNGLFRGTFTPPGSGSAIAFGGAIVQGQTNGSGFFRNGGQSGHVFFGPVPGP
jgi:hypothetical protein